MSRFMSAVWVLQLWLLLAAATLVLVRPEAVLYFLEECVTLPAAPQHLPDPGPACVIIAGDRGAKGLFAITRILAPFLLTFAMFSLHAVMREEERVRRSLSFVFAFIYVVLAAFLYTDSFSDAGLRHPDFLPRTLLAGLVTLALFTGYSALRASDRTHRVTWLLVLAGYVALAAMLARGAPAQTIAKLSLVVFAVDSLLGDIERLRARAFCLLLLFPAVLAVMDALSPSSSHSIDDEPLAIRIFLGVMVTCVVIHALYAVWPMEAAARRLSGSANTRPSALWVLWLFQGLGYLAVAGSLIWAHRRGASVSLEGMIDPAYRHLFADLDEIFPAFVAAVGLFSFTGMQSSREWVWKAHCAIFASFYAALLLCGLLVWSSDLFRSWTPALAVPALILLGVHLWFYYSRREWFSEEVGEGPDGWVLMDLVLGPLLMVRTLISRRRAMHARGVAAHGTMRVLPRAEAGYPEHDFFQATDQPFTVQIRDEQRALPRPLSPAA